MMDSTYKHTASEHLRTSQAANANALVSRRETMRETWHSRLQQDLMMITLGVM